MRRASIRTRCVAAVVGCRAEGGSTRGGDTAVPGERLMSVGQGCQRWWDVPAAAARCTLGASAAQPGAVWVFCRARGQGAVSGPALALPPVLRLGRGREARGTRREALHLVLQVKGEEEPAAEAAAEVDFGSKKK
eukprot:scaffold109745_cov66-Phaeocystis_antarctica.AAC.1